MQEKADAHRYGDGWQRTGIIAFDSMTMQGGVWYQHHTGRIRGFPYDDRSRDVVLSEFNTHAAKLNDDSKVSDLERSIPTFM